jgi:hypothetical protein
VLASSTLKPCGEGEERNPETNRCRKVALASADGMPVVQDVNSANTSPPTKWYLIAVVMVGALGYALYEWRHEAVAAAKGVGSRIKTKT